MQPRVPRRAVGHVAAPMPRHGSRAGNRPATRRRRPPPETSRGKPFRATPSTAIPLDQTTDQESSDPGNDLHLSTAGHHHTGSHPWLIIGSARLRIASARTRCSLRAPRDRPRWRASRMHSGSCMILRAELDHVKLTIKFSKHAGLRNGVWRGGSWQRFQSCINIVNFKTSNIRFL